MLVVPFSCASGRSPARPTTARRSPRRWRHRAARRYRHPRCAGGDRRLIGRSRGATSIVLLTDGYDETQHASPRGCADRPSRRAGRRSTSIGVGGVAGISLKGERLLKQLAAATGGRAFFPCARDRAADRARSRRLRRARIATCSPTRRPTSASTARWRAIDAANGRCRRTWSATSRATSRPSRRRSGRRSSSRSPMPTAPTMTCRATT